MTATISDRQVEDQTEISKTFVETLRGVLGTPARPIPLHEPNFDGNEKRWVADCIDSGWVSSVGPFVTQFEQRLAEISGVRRAVAVVNGTAALHACLIGLGVESGDEVLMPALTFVATANAVSYCGATPHFVDVEEMTLGIDPGALDDYLGRIAVRRENAVVNRETGRRISALVPVHIFGHPVDMDPLTDVAERFGIPIVEDATEALGSRYKGRPCGGLSRVAALSFNGNKIVTTGGGGAILCDDDAFANRLRHLTTTGKQPHPWHFFHDVTAYNYRMPNLNAALGLAQLERLDSFVESKRRMAERYRAAFAGVDGLTFFAEKDFATSNYWLNAVLLDRSDPDLMEALLAASNAAGYMTRPAWTPMHRLPMYAQCPRADLPVTENLAGRIVNLPSGVGLECGEAGR